MLIPIKWLKEYVKTDLSNQQIADALTLAGLTIEEIKNDVLDGEVTSNRSDWLSIFGVARELAAITNSELTILSKPDLKIKNESLININFDTELVLRYSGYVIKNIQIKESPDWLKQKLTKAGVRAINNVVDITNYVMLETGQPLHSFDCDKMTGDITIRRAKAGETITTLDQIPRPADENIIVAENNGQLIDLVGIMGGALSDTTEQTKNIFLQAAVFPPTLIRKSSKTIKLSTEASYRYERGVDYTKNTDYLDLAAAMILELAGGEICQLVDEKVKNYDPPQISWQLSDAEALIGVKIDETKSLNWLDKLGIKTVKEADHFVSTSPSWRFDLNIKEDIIEEIARFLIVDSMPRTQLKPLPPQKNNSPYYQIEAVKDQLVGLGLNEMDGYSFLSGKNLLDAKLDPKKCLEASNPLSEEYQYLRPSLLPDMLLAVAQNPLFNPVSFFEIGNIFQTELEQTNLGIIIAGNDQETESYKQNVEKWLESQKIDTKLTKITPEILKSYKIRKKSVYFIEIPFAKIGENLKETSFTIPEMNQHYTSISKFPAVKRDLAIIVDKSINPQAIIETIIKQSPENLEILSELFDEFVSDRFGVGKKSLAFHILYQPIEKTLTDNEAQQIHEKIITKLKEEFQAEPRI